MSDNILEGVLSATSNYSFTYMFCVCVRVRACLRVEKEYLLFLCHSLHLYSVVICF